MRLLIRSLAEYPRSRKRSRIYQTSLVSLISFPLAQVEYIFDVPVVDKLLITFLLFFNFTEIGKSANTLRHKIADHFKCLLSIAEPGNVNVGSDFRCAQTT